MKVKVELSYKELRNIYKILNRAKWFLSDQGLVTFNDHKFEGTRLFCDIRELINKLSRGLPSEEVTDEVNIFKKGN